MKTLSIVSFGMGGSTLTLASKEAVTNADALLGAPRMLTAFASLNKPTFSAYTPEAVREVLVKESYESYALLVSGDAGFFSAADALCQALSDDVSVQIKVHPGISSLQYLFAKCKRSWQDAAIVSCHGRIANLVDTVRRNKAIFALTGGNVAALAQELTDAGFGALSVTVGDNLGMENERIQNCAAADLLNTDVAKLSVLLIDNPGFDDRIRFGIPDEEFVRGDVPMTKAEVRAVTLSKLALFPGAVCYDVGCGTGSVTVEMALAAYKGRVYAVDSKPEAIDLTRRNLVKFHIGNVVPVLGSAPDALSELPPPDAAFIGGSGGNMGEIFDCILAKNPSARIVVNAIALESVTAALAAYSAHGIKPEIIQLGVSRAKPVSSLHMLTANNPVFILSGGGYER